MLISWRKRNRCQVSVARKWQACFRSASFANRLSARRFLRSPKRWIALVARSRLYEGWFVSVVTSHKSCRKFGLETDPTVWSRHFGEGKNLLPLPEFEPVLPCHSKDCAIPAPVRKFVQIILGRLFITDRAIFHGNLWNFQGIAIR